MTTPESSRLIAETLRLDGEATQGPWMHDDEAHYIVGDHGPQVANLDLGKGRSGTRIIDIRGWGVLVNAFGPKEAERIQRANAAIVCHSRTSAPRLARIAKMQSEAMAWIGGDGPKPSWFAEAIKREPRRNYGDIDMQVISRYVLAEIEKIARDGA